MDTATQHLPPSPAARGRPRNPPPETPAARIERLQRELEAAQAALAAEAERRAAIVGSVVLGHMAKDADFSRQIRALVRSGVKRKDDLAAVAPLLAEG